ncbi:hypothetical protein FF38_06630 [Lucilia cuprina]|uniref:Uncharacterized protein n=1 Tax=Lucilia cuprina TaxID=7375 RepID=A0A0L0CNJ7_LUCCU|nr:hypothetical protein FF38_06630 [Lucilia cuprina]
MKCARHGLLQSRDLKRGLTSAPHNRVIRVAGCPQDLSWLVNWLWFLRLTRIGCDLNPNSREEEAIQITEQAGFEPIMQRSGIKARRDGWQMLCMVVTALSLVSASKEPSQWCGGATLLFMVLYMVYYANNSLDIHPCLSSINLMKNTNKKR